MTDSHTPSLVGAHTETHTHSPVCHFLISCCSVLKPRPLLCREWTLRSLLFVMLIRLSLTVPCFFLSTCIYCVLPRPPPPSAPCTAGLFGVPFSLSLLHSRLLQPVILYSSQVLFKSSSGQGWTEILIWCLC